MHGLEYCLDMQPGCELLRKGNRFVECLGVFISVTSCNAGGIIRIWGKSGFSSQKGNPSRFLKISSLLSHVCFRHVFAFHAILASGTDTIVFCWRQTILCLVVMRILLYFSYISWVRELVGLLAMIFSSMWWQLGSLSGFLSWQMDWLYVGGPGYLCCHVWCLGWGWLEGRAQLSFSLHWSPRPHHVVCSRVRLLSWWFKTLRESVPRNPRKSSEASEELTSGKVLGIPSCHILLSGRSLGQSRVKKRNENFLSMEASFNWPQMFSNHMAFHMGPWNWGASFLWEAVNMSLYC